MLKEKFTRYDLLAFIFISGGVTGCVLLANDEKDDYTTQQIYDIIQQA